MSNNVAQSIPSTKEAVAGLQNAQNYLDDRSQQAGVGAQRTVSDVNQAIQDAKSLVKDKDLGDSVLKLVNDAAAVGEQAKRNAQAASQQLRAEGGSVNTAGLSQEQLERVSRDAHEAASQIRRAAQLTVTSPSFRSFLWDYYQLVRDTWAPQLNRAVEQRLKEGRQDDLTQQADRKSNELRDQARQQVNQVSNEAQARKEELSRVAQDVRQAAARGDAKSAIAGVRDSANDISREARQKLDEQLPPEKRQELVQRWQNLKRQLQEDPNLRAALDDLKGAINRLRQDAQPALEKASQQVQQLKEVAKEKSQQAKQAGQQADTSGLQQVARDARDLIEKFADGRSLQPLIDAVRDSARAIQQDQELRQWLDEVWSWGNQTKQDSQKLNDDQHLQQLNNLIDKGRSLTQGRYRQIAESLLSETQDYIRALRNDAVTTRLQQSLANVVGDLFVDQTGKFVLKPDVYKELAKALAPSFRDLFQDVRIAHIEEHNDKADFALDNIQIDASDIQPNQLDVTSIADVSLGKQDTSADLRFRISAKGITPKVRNTYFRYEKHTFPKLSDFGTVDAALTGDGLSFIIDLETVFNEKTNQDQRSFRARDIKVDLKGLKLDFHNAQHETLYKIFKPMIVSRLTKQMETTIRDQLYNYVDELDNAVTDSRLRVAQAVEQAAGDRVVRGVDNNVGHAQPHDASRDAAVGQVSGNAARRADNLGGRAHPQGDFRNTRAYQPAQLRSDVPYESRIAYPRNIQLA